MSAPELLPCPFCGAKPHRNMSKVKHDQLHGEPYQDLIVKCPHLCASMEGSEDTVIERWNTRAVLAAFKGVQGRSVHEFEADWYRPARCQLCGERREHINHCSHDAAAHD